MSSALLDSGSNMAETKRTLLERIDRNLQALLSLFPASLRLRFGTPEGKISISTPRGTQTMTTIKDNQTDTITLEVDDAAGNSIPLTDVQFPSPPTWTSSDPTVLTVTPNADGLSAVGATTGKLGTSTVSVSATTSDGRSISGSDEVDVTTSAPTSFKLVFGTPTDK